MKQSIRYGIHPITLLLQVKPHLVTTLMIQEGKDNPKISEIRQLAEDHHITIQPISKKKIDALTGEENHQGVVAYIQGSDEGIALKDFINNYDEGFPKDMKILALDGIQDPHNLGACLRSAAALGAHAVLLPQQKSAQITPLVHKIASGAIISLTIVKVPNLARALKLCQDKGAWVVGAVANAPEPIKNMERNMPLVLIIGSEGEGLRQQTQTLCDQCLSIPIDPSIESLNASVACGIMLYEAMRGA